MSAYTALYFVTALALVALAFSPASSSACISCPCGSIGQNFIHCFNGTANEKLNCEIWANCQTCAVNATFCSSCPTDYFGPACSEVCGQIPPRTTRRRGSPNVGNWPWSMGIAALSRDGAEDLFCGGVILDKNTVLTAAQCVLETQNTRLLFGTFYPTPAGDSGAEQKRSIFKVILHPEFDNETKANDIALLKFEPELNFSQTIQPICLPGLNFSKNFLLSGQNGTIPGWGYNYTLYISIPAVTYEVAIVSVQSDDKCTEACQRRGLPSCSTPKMFCADYPQGVDACLYRGVPMVIHDEEKERYTLAGLVTRKLDQKERNCRRGETDTVLTNVSHFMPFILRNLS